MKRELTSFTVEEITKLIKLNPATLETAPDTVIKVNIELDSCKSILRK